MRRWNCALWVRISTRCAGRATTCARGWPGVDGGHGPHRHCRRFAQADAGGGRGPRAASGPRPGQVARQMEAGLEGVTGGSLLEGTEELPVRVRLGAGLRGDPVAIGDMPILPPGAAQVAAGPVSRRAALHARHAAAGAVGKHDHPAQRRAGEYRAGLPDAGRPARRGAGRGHGGAGGDGYARPRASGWKPAATAMRATARCRRLIAPGPHHHAVDRRRGDDLQLLPPDADRLRGRGPVGGLSMLALAVFDYPFGINAIIGVIGSIGVSINAALIVLSGLQEDPRGPARATARRWSMWWRVRPAHHLDHDHDLRRLPAADPRRRRVLAALRHVGRGRCGAVGDAGLRLHAADVRPDPVASDPAAVPKLLAFTEDTPVGLVVAAAGFGSVGAFLDQDAASEMNMVDLNCRSVVELSYGFGLRMAVQKRGGIVLFGSLLGFNGAPLSATYAATKGFIQSFAEGIAVEMRPLGVNVLSVAPGPVGTGFAARAGMQMGKAATPEMVARSALAALGRRTTVRPGFLAKFLGWSLAMLPRWGRVQVMGVIMKGMMGKKTAPKTARDAAVTKG
jgi:uncharacterized protein